jgi:hypothetical protein
MNAEIFLYGSKGAKQNNDGITDKQSGRRRRDEKKSEDGDKSIYNGG